MPKFVAGAFIATGECGENEVTSVLSFINDVDAKGRSHNTACETGNLSGCGQSIGVGTSHRTEASDWS